VDLTNIRQIAPAVRDLRAKLGNPSFRRRSPKLNYAKAQQRWWIQVRFNSDIDVAILEKAVAESDIRLVEFLGSFYIEDPSIPDTADMRDAFRLAEIVLAQLNGAVKVACSHFQPAIFEAMIELSEDGTGRGITACDPVIHGAANYPVIESFIAGDSTPITSIEPLWKRDKDLQEALFYLGAEGNTWANLYKVTEIIEDRAGGQKEVFGNGWCPRAQWEQFRRTANHQEAIGRFSRHARSRAIPPPDPMTIEEAKVFTAGLTSRWIDSMRAAQT
jgi:hypothetical protein